MVSTGESNTNPSPAEVPTSCLPKTRLMGMKINLSLQAKLLRAKSRVYEKVNLLQELGFHAFIEKIRSRSNA